MSTPQPMRGGFEGPPEREAFVYLGAARDFFRVPFDDAPLGFLQYHALSVRPASEPDGVPVTVHVPVKPPPSLPTGLRRGELLRLHGLRPSTTGAVGAFDADHVSRWHGEQLDAGAIAGRAQLALIGLIAAAAHEDATTRMARDALARAEQTGADAADLFRSDLAAVAAPPVEEQTEAQRLRLVAQEQRAVTLFVETWLGDWPDADLLDEVRRLWPGFDAGQARALITATRAGLGDDVAQVADTPWHEAASVLRARHPGVPVDQLRALHAEAQKAS